MHINLLKRLNKKIFSFRKERKGLILSSTSYTYIPRQIIVGSGQSVGRSREKNEDALFTMATTVSDGLQAFPFGLFIVADGMGGHQNGEFASGLAVRTIVSYLIPRIFSLLMNNTHDLNEKKYQRILLNAINKAQNAVLSQAPGSGTTLTAALVVENSVLIAHIGDSRAYLICPDKEIVALTRDHSLVQKLVDSGMITEEQAQDHPQKNILYRAIGQSAQLQVDFNSFPFPENSYIMICSDGLWGVVQQEEIFRIVSSEKNLSNACHLLVQSANARGGPDNISVLIFSM